MGRHSCEDDENRQSEKEATKIFSDHGFVFHVNVLTAVFITGRKDLIILCSFNF